MFAVLWLAAPPAHPHFGPHDIDCSGPEIIIEGGQPSPFVLPSQTDQKLDIEPGAILTIRGVDLPADASLHWGLRGLGTELAGRDLQFIS